MVEAYSQTIKEQTVKRYITEGSTDTNSGSDNEHESGIKKKFKLKMANYGDGIKLIKK